MTETNDPHDPFAEHAGVEDEEHEESLAGHHDHAGGHEEGGHGEPWLVSYADLMTLLFGFFVLMYSFEAAKNSDDQSMVRMRKELAQYFGGGYINPLKEVAVEFKKQIEGKIRQSKDVTIFETPEGLEITFQSATLFASGSADLNPNSENFILPLISLVKEKKQDFSITVEGYTDDNPIKSDKFPSNWELSGARASTVLRLFEKAGLDSNRLTAVGYGETRPSVPNRDVKGTPIPENQAKNRRVRILILNNLEAKNAEAAAAATNATKADQT